MCASYSRTFQAMDPPQEGFDELERAFGHAKFLRFDHTTDEIRNSLGWKRPAAHVSRPVPTTYADIPSSDDESPRVSPISPVNEDDHGHNDHEPFDVAITPPLERRVLSRHNSGLPPTPPTMTSSDISEQKAEHETEIVALFADRVRNALETQKQKSGHSTPVMGNISPPTPDTSPPGTTDDLLPAARPELMQYPSSYAESFKTATEGLGGSRNASRCESRALVIMEEMPTQEQAQPPMRVEILRPARLPGLQPFMEHLEKSLVEDSDRSEARVRVKNYHIESDSSDFERSVTYLAGDEKSMTDESPPSPTTRKALISHRAEFQRLRRPYQPGDDLRRPDEALIYGSSGSIKRSKDLGQRKALSKRDMNTGLLRNAQSPKPRPSKSPDVRRPASPISRQQNETPRPPEIPDARMATPPNLREFAPSEAPPEVPSPPTTAAKQSLEDNNKVYKMIQEENVKRHSAISDGSVQALVLPVADYKHRLRHTAKRESLRGDPGFASNEMRILSDSGNKLRHKRPMSSLGIRESAAQPVTEDQEKPKFSARISRIDPGENGFAYWSAMSEDSQAKRMSLRSTTPFERPSSQRTLRRSVREQSLDRLPPTHTANESRRISFRPDRDSRPWGTDATSLHKSSPSPMLKRTSRERSLDRNLEVRRTSIGCIPQFQPLEVPQDEPAQGSGATRANQENVPQPTVADTEPFPSGQLPVEDFEQIQRTSRKFSFDQNSFKDSKKSVDQSTAREQRPSSEKLLLSPKRKSFDPRYLNTHGTPFSARSQFSDRTEAELCEARGVEIFPHNNKSLLLVQQGSQPPEKSRSVDFDSFSMPGPLTSHRPHTPFNAVIEEPFETEEQIGMSNHTVDSPLRNPRPAPEPPVIQFIPPTPNQELERPLGGAADGTVTENPRKNMQRRTSLTQRVRRYSESLIQPLPFGRTGSVRKSKKTKAQPVEEQRPTHLSSFWQPRNFWEGYDSDDDYSDDEEGFEPLPAGGDTSDVGYDDHQATSDHKKTSFFPRNMSVRMPGFRGNGGFLQGNSLGIARHGTNNRRNYIDKRTSEEMLKRMSGQRSHGKTFTVPFTGGTRLEYVGFAGIGASMSKVRRRRAEKAAEKRREKLRGQIGTRVYHIGGTRGTGGGG